MTLCFILNEGFGEYIIHDEMHRKYISNIIIQLIIII